MTCLLLFKKNNNDSFPPFEIGAPAPILLFVFDKILDQFSKQLLLERSIFSLITTAFS